MKQVSFCLTALLAFVLMAAHVQAQINVPQPSPQSTVTQVVGLTKVTLDYSRPSMRGRKVFGDLLPYGELWRTGANASTKLSFSDEVTIGGKKIPAGEYSLFTIPGQNEWTVIINKNAKASANEYKQTEDAARFTVKPEKIAKPVETFTINFADLTNTGATIELLWENTRVPVKVETDVDTKVMAQIKEKMATATDEDRGIYYMAAVYYLDTDRDPKQALEWMNKATAKDPQFWQLHQKAKIQAKLKDYEGAIATAQKSIELAKAAKNNDYVRLNEKAIAEWKKTKKS